MAKGEVSSTKCLVRVKRRNAPSEQISSAPHPKADIEQTF